MEEKGAFEFYIVFMGSFKDVHSDGDLNMNLLSIFINKDNVYPVYKFSCQHLMLSRVEMFYEMNLNLLFRFRDSAERRTKIIVT